ncbi:MAG: class I SAM-dependent methyltransferase [Holdemania massiliensis]
MRSIVTEWYETKENVNQMEHLESSHLKKWVLTVAKLFPEKSKILDVGCGLGREAFVLSDMGFVVTGIDISHEVITRVTALSSEKGYDITFEWYDGHKLPFENNSFDAVIIWAQTFDLLYGNEYKHGVISANAF